MHLMFTPRKREIYHRLRIADRCGILLFVTIGVVTISGQILSIGAMRYILVSITGLVTLCTPLLVIPASRLFYKDTEKISLGLFLGAGLTFAGIFSIVRS